MLNIRSTNPESVAILDLPGANVASISAAVRRLGLGVEVVNDAEAVYRARKLIVPGVGHFGYATRWIKQMSLRDPLRERLTEKGQTFGICLGMQLLMSGSEEAFGEGLAYFEGNVQALRGGEKSVHYGWSQILNAEKQPMGFGYFAHSFALHSSDSGVPPDRRINVSHKLSFCTFGQEFVAMIQCGSIWATQFHPELSGKFGQTILRKWLYEEDYT